MKTCRILVVEDDDRIMDQIGDVLFSLGHEHERATSLAEAQERLEAQTFDLVLLDLHIPARSGAEGPA